MNRAFKLEGILVVQYTVESQQVARLRRILQNNWETKDFLPIKHFECSDLLFPVSVSKKPLSGYSPAWRQLLWMDTQSKGVHDRLLPQIQLNLT
jgi:hypothetical protein